MIETATSAAAVISTPSARFTTPRWAHIRWNVGPGPPTLDAAAVRAFAHPLRLRLFYLLEADGPVTASGLAAKVGESSGSTSYHLRQLARHGVIVEVQGRGTARERWWETDPAGFTVRGDRMRADPATAAAAGVLLTEFVRQRLAESQAWLDEALTADPAWVEASRDHRRTMVLTRTELARLGAEIEHPTPAAVPYLAVRDARAAIDWYATVFGATVEGDPYLGDDGSIGHASLRIGAGVIYGADEAPDYGAVAPHGPGSPVSLMLPVPDTRTVLDLAVREGAVADDRGVYDAYGSSNAWFVDPFGHRWGISGPLRG